jgi:hypothetical protein
MGASISELDLYMRLEILKLLNIKITAIWDVMPSGLGDRFRLFEALRHPLPSNVSSEKTN